MKIQAVTQGTMSQSAASDQTSATRLFVASLRYVGLSAILVGIAASLFGGIHLQTDLHSFLVLMATAGMCVAAAITTRSKFGDRLGAKALFVCSLLFVPVGFAALGAMWYGWAPLDGVAWLQAIETLSPSAPYAGFAVWQTSTTRELAIASVIAAIVLIPSAIISARALSSDTSTRWQLLYIAGNALLLLPVRQPDVLALVSIMGFIPTFVTARITQLKDDGDDGRKSRLLTLLLFTPLLILTGRTVLLYEPNTYSTLGITVIVFLLIRRFMSMGPKHDGTQKLLYLFATLTLLAAAILLAQLLYTLGSPFLLIMSAAVGSILAALRSLKQRIESRISSVIETLIAVAAMGIGTPALYNALDLSAAGFQESLLQLVVAASLLSTVMAYCILTRRRLLAVLALVVALLPLLGMLLNRVQHLQHPGWTLVIGMGLIAMLLAACLERPNSTAVVSSPN